MELRDNYVYFIFYGDDPAGFNFKVSLFDIIPWELYDDDEICDGRRSYK